MRLRSLTITLSVLVTLCLTPHVQFARADSSAESPYPRSPTWPPGIRRFLRVETSPTIFNVLYRWGQIVPEPDGAYGPNVVARRSAWYVEYQRAGSTDVIAGVLHDNSEMIAEGLEMFRFGLLREAPGGSFPGSIWPFHGTAMFLAESAPALIVLKYSPLAPSFDPELEWETRRMRRAARHLIAVVHGAGKIDDPTKNHRFYEAAMALGSVGVLAGDRLLRNWSTRYAWEAIHMERPSGVMLEDGGHDTGYQGLGMVNATRYLDLVATGRLRSALYIALARGENWELSRVRADGTINQHGDTRTVGCRELNPEGQCKTTLYAPIFSALARWSVISRNSRFQRAAYTVWLQNRKLSSGNFLSPASLQAQRALALAGCPARAPHDYDPGSDGTVRDTSMTVSG